MKMNRSLVLSLIFLISDALFLSCVQKEQQVTELKNKKVTRVGSLIKVRPEYEERYIILHKNTFPGVLNRIRESNISNYSIFLRDGILFSYFEYIGNNFEGDMAKIGDDQTTRDWWKLTDPMQEPLETRKEGEWWAEADAIFYMENMRLPYTQVSRYAFVIELMPEYEAEFKNLYNNVPQSVITRLQESNIQKYAIYLKDRRLYAYLEYIGNDLKADMAKLADHPDMQQWWDKTTPMQKKVETVEENEWWAEMKEVFHTD